MFQYEKGKDSAYDLNTYWGRLKHFQSLSNQRNWFYSDKYLNEMKEIVDDFDSGKNTDRTNEELWKAKYIVLGNYHMQTNELLPRLLRTSGYCIINSPVIFALAMIPPTPTNQMVFQTANQVFNFAYNFMNGNKSNEYKNSELAVSLSLAVLSAIAGSVGTLKLVQNLPIAPAKRALLTRFAPFIGICVANEANLFFSRVQDFQKGIQVQDAKSGETIPGLVSISAAKTAYYQTAISRLVIPVPVFFGPQLFHQFQVKFNLAPKNAILSNIINTSFGAFSLYLGLTYALALYPQNVRVHPTALEPAFHNLKDKDGNPIELLQFNKGL